MSKSGDKRTARVWCPRRQKQMHVGTFNTTPEAAAAVASAEHLGPENLPTPAGRKRARKNQVRASPHGAALAAVRLRTCVCDRPLERGTESPPRMGPLDPELFDNLDMLFEEQGLLPRATTCDERVCGAGASRDAAAVPTGRGANMSSSLPVLVGPSQPEQRRARPLPPGLRVARART